jgi:molybdopterin-biosynthesis enzyme MoeA-like protein
MPAGATLEVTDEVRWPTLLIGNVWLLPGVPEIFRMKLPVVLAKLGAGPAYVSRAVYVNMDEGELKPLLDEIVARFPAVDVGSYPRWLDARYKTKVTFDGQAVDQVDAAHDAFVARLPPGEPQRAPEEP